MYVCMCMYDLLMRGQLTAYIISFIEPMTDSTEGKWKCFLF